MKKRYEFIRNLKGQVWVETVVYTLIALTVIGLFLSFAKPKIEEVQDKTLIDQSVSMLEDINNIANSIVQSGAGNKRVIELGIKKGTLEIDSANDRLVFTIEGRSTYTEPGEDGSPGEFIKIGNILISTQKLGKLNKVTLISNYSGIYNITYQNKEELRTINRAPTPYKVSISSEGELNGRNVVNFEVI